MRSPLPALLIVVAGCLEPRVSDEVPEDDLILPAGRVVPSLDDDPVLGPQIASADGVEGLIPLLSGFAGGKAVRWWNFGPAPDHAAPLYVLVRKNSDDTFSSIGHPTIVDRVPGDAGYSPFWAIWFVEVTSFYSGQLITSVQAMQYAREEGLLGKPIPQGINVNCPVVAKGVLLQIADDQPGIAADRPFYYEGRLGHYFDFGASALGSDGVTVPETTIYVLRHEGGEPVSEPARLVDMTGDGDLRDTNDILTGVGPLARVVEVTVTSGSKLIDRSGDQSSSELRSQTDLFLDGLPVTSHVVAYRPTDMLWNAQLAPEVTP
jgi:hypothetical protein